jgi:hypothetical protein
MKKANHKTPKKNNSLRDSMIKISRNMICKNYLSNQQKSKLTKITIDLKDLKSIEKRIK